MQREDHFNHTVDDYSRCFESNRFVSMFDFFNGLPRCFSTLTRKYCANSAYEQQDVCR